GSFNAICDHAGNSTIGLTADADTAPCSAACNCVVAAAAVIELFSHGRLHVPGDIITADAPQARTWADSDLITGSATLRWRASPFWLGAPLSPCAPTYRRSQPLAC